MASLVDMGWIPLIPALPAVGFLIWVFVNLARDRMRKRDRDWSVRVRRGGKGGNLGVGGRPLDKEFDRDLG